MIGITAAAAETERAGLVKLLRRAGRCYPWAFSENRNVFPALKGKREISYFRTWVVTRRPSSHLAAMVFFYENGYRQICPAFALTTPHFFKKESENQ